MFNIFSNPFKRNNKGRKTDIKELKNLALINNKQLSKYKRQQLKKHKITN